MTAPARQHTQGESIAVLATQMVEVIKDISDLRNELRDHRDDHRTEEQDRVRGRRWLIGAIVGAIAAVDGPLVTLWLARGR